MGGFETRTDELRSTLSGLVYEIRPWQWYKQGILLVGIVFAGRLFDPVAWRQVVLGVIAFCAVAGSVYVFNDISDVEEDRNHPEKRHRPIASGQVAIPTAGAFGAVLLVFGLAISYSVGVPFLAVVVAYVAQNAIYSAALKDVVLVDVMIVALGFVLRAVAGVVAIDAYLSPWLVVCTFLAALLLAIGKRRHELRRRRDPSSSRSSLGEYTTEGLDQLLVVTAATLLMSYCLYTFFRADRAMMLSLPFAFFGVFRYHHLVHAEDVGANPEYLALDRPFALNFLTWTAVAIGVLYDVHLALAVMLP